MAKGRSCDHWQGFEWLFSTIPDSLHSKDTSPPSRILGSMSKLGTCYFHNAVHPIFTPIFPKSLSCKLSEEANRHPLISSSLTKTLGILFFCFGCFVLFCFLLKHEFWGSNLGFHACITSTWPSESSSQSGKKKTRKGNGSITSLLIFNFCFLNKSGHIFSSFWLALPFRSQAMSLLWPLPFWTQKC